MKEPEKLSNLIDDPDEWVEAPRPTIPPAPAPLITPDVPSGDIVVEGNLTERPQVFATDTTRMEEIGEQFKVALANGKTADEALDAMGVKGSERSTIRRLLFQNLVQTTINEGFLPPPVALEYVRSADNLAMQEALQRRDLKTYNKIADRRMRDPAFAEQKREKKTFKVPKAVVDKLLESEIVDVSIEEDE